ncbi:MAG: hypothetical protein Q3989_04160 [Eubacteriales bacterium]|nr:hypothetical protein [Eubacteriales bacterium]
MNKVKWIFFDIGSTLVDERVAYKNRIKKTIANTDISYKKGIGGGKATKKTPPIL